MAPGRQDFSLIRQPAGRGPRGDSPVIAISPRTGREVSSDASAVTRSRRRKGRPSGSPDARAGALPNPVERRIDTVGGALARNQDSAVARRFLHHVAEVAGERRLPLLHP